MSQHHFPRKARDGKLRYRFDTRDRSSLAAESGGEFDRSRSWARNMECLPSLLATNRAPLYVLDESIESILLRAPVTGCTALSLQAKNQWRLSALKLSLSSQRTFTTARFQFPNVVL